MSSEDIKPELLPDLNLPSSDHVVEVSILDTACDIVVPAGSFLKPVLKGLEEVNLPTFSFHIRSKHLNREILFDIGCRKDWWNLAPLGYQGILNGIPALNTRKDIADVLAEGNVDRNNISAVILSHWHWDHCGDMTLFPKSTDLVVGPGFSEKFLPGYPKREDSALLAADFDGRKVEEIQFDDSFKIGKYPAYDYFGDGSFYILNVPGHAIGHISALARTTPTTFVLMGGDVTHFGGAFRPTPYNPLPATIPPETKLSPTRFTLPCACSIFTACHPHSASPKIARTTPYFGPSDTPDSWYVDPPAATTSISTLAEFDAHPDVLVCIAHDEGLIDVVDFYPKGTLNQWQEKRWKEMSNWGFLNALPIDGKPAKGWFCEGLMRDGKVWRPEA
ncbi:MAG: hypothetical protein M1834_002459 [Cirrosporium novae-zelandiae]|nr:MAG: hypothetical protein M1834_002459 [Cirrosporium novae-zelandiae]